MTSHAVWRSRFAFPSYSPSAPGQWKCAYTSGHLANDLAVFIGVSPAPSRSPQSGPRARLCGSIIVTFACHGHPRIADPGLKLWPFPLPRKGSSRGRFGSSPRFLCVRAAKATYLLNGTILFSRFHEVECEQVVNAVHGVFTLCGENIFSLTKRDFWAVLNRYFYTFFENFFSFRSDSCKLTMIAFCPTPSACAI